MVVFFLFKYTSWTRCTRVYELHMTDWLRLFQYCMFNQFLKPELNMVPREGQETVKQTLKACGFVTEALISKSISEKSVDFFSNFSRFYWLFGIYRPCFQLLSRSFQLVKSKIETWLPGFFLLELLTSVYCWGKSILVLAQSHNTDKATKWWISIQDAQLWLNFNNAMFWPRDTPF